MADSSVPPAALFLSTSWKKNLYGPATWQLICDFCEETLKKKRHELSAIYFTVLDVEVSEEQQDNAARCGVTLITATRKRFVDPEEDPPAVHWLINHNNYYQVLGKLQGVEHVVALCEKTKNAASIIHEELFPHAELHHVSPEPAALFVSNTWSNDELGLIGFHRNLMQDFCKRKAEARESVRAYSMVIDVEISDGQRIDAERCGATLIPAQIKTQIGPKEDRPYLEWLLNHEKYNPDLKALENVKYVVGYAPKTGHVAVYIREKLFPKAILVLINHASPESACLETREYGVLEFEENMLQMASKADLVFSIGPVIYEYFQNAYRAEVQGKDLSEMPHEEILPIPLPYFRVKDPVMKDQPSKHSILTCGQIDTQKAIERCETMAVSIGAAANYLSGSQSSTGIKPPLWKIQGVSEQDTATPVGFLSNKMQCQHIIPTLQPGHSAKSLHRSLQQSHLCLPAPCYIDYSFYGLEAMTSGLPTAVYEYSHLACFVEKYLKEHADQVVVEATVATLSKRIIDRLQNTPLAFKKAKALKTDLVNCKAVSVSCAKFASLLTTTVRPQTEVSSSKDDGVRRDAKDSLPVTVGLDDAEVCRCLKELEKQVEDLPPQRRKEVIEEMNNVQAAWKDCKKALKRRVENVLGNEDGCQEIERLCKRKLGDVEPSSLIAKSLAILLRFFTIFNLYRLKQTCISGSLAKAFAPLLITDEMREFAAKAGITLQLKAMYDQERFREVELFFINRDGGGIQPMTTHDGVSAEDYVEDIKAKKTSQMERKVTKVFLEDQEQKLSETSLYKVYTETNINEFEKEQKPSEIISCKGSEMEAATSTQPEMTGWDEHGIKTEMVTTATEHQTEKKDSGDMFGKFFKRLVGRKDKTDGRSKVTSGGEKEQSGSVTASSKELSIRPVSSMMSGGITLPGSKEGQSGSYSRDGLKSTSPGLDEFVPSDNQMRWLAFGIHAEKLIEMITRCLSDFFDMYDTYLKHNKVQENISATVRIAVVSIAKWSHCDFQEWGETSYSQDMEHLIHAFEALDENGTEKRLMSKLKDGKSKELAEFLKNMTPGLQTKLSNFLSKVSTTSKRNSRTSKDDAEAMKERVDSAHDLIRWWTTSVESSESKSSTYDEVIVTFILRVLLVVPILMFVNVNIIVICLIILMIAEKHCSETENMTHRFIGRTLELQNLRKIFDIDCNDVRAAVVSGKKGMGKTELVNEYVWQYATQYQGGVFRISARNEDTLYNSLKAISIDKNLGGIDSRDCLRKFQENLKSKSNWLIIVDDVNTSNLSDDVNDIINGPWKRVAVGHMIVVTRCDKSESAEFVKGIEQPHCLEISEMNAQDAAKFFTSVNSDDDARQLAGEFRAIPGVLSEANNTMSLYDGDVKTFLQEVRRHKESNEGAAVETKSDNESISDILMQAQSYAIDNISTGQKQREQLLARRLLKSFALMGDASIPFYQVSDGLYLIDDYLHTQKNREDVWRQLLKITHSNDELNIPSDQRESLRVSLSADEKVSSLVDACKLLQPCLEEMLKTNKGDIAKKGEQQFMQKLHNILCHAIEVSKCILDSLNEEVETSSEQREVMAVCLYRTHIICQVSGKHSEALIFQRNATVLMTTIDDKARDSCVTNTLSNTEYNIYTTISTFVEKTTMQPPSPVDYKRVKRSNAAEFSSLWDAFDTCHEKSVTAAECMRRANAWPLALNETFGKIAKCRSCKLDMCRVRRMCDFGNSPLECDITYLIPEGTIELKDLRANNRYVAETREKNNILVSKETSEVREEGIIYLEGFTIEINHTLVIGRESTLILKDCDLRCNIASSYQHSPSFAAFLKFESHDVKTCPIAKNIRYGIGKRKLTSKKFISGSYECRCEGIDKEEMSGAALILKDDSKLLITNCTLCTGSKSSNGILATQNSTCIIDNSEIFKLNSALTVLGGNTLVQNSRLHDNVTAIQHFPLSIQSRLSCVSNHIFKNDKSGIKIISRFEDVNAEYDLDSNYIYDNGNGLRLESDGRVSVENNSFYNNFRGVYISGCKNIYVTNNNVYENKDIGIYVVNVTDDAYSSVVDKSNKLSLNGRYDVQRSLLHVRELKRGGSLDRENLILVEPTKKRELSAEEIKCCSVCFKKICKPSLSCANCLALKFCSESCQIKHVSGQVNYCTELRKNFTVQFKLEGFPEFKSHMKQVTRMSKVQAHLKERTIMLKIMNGFHHEQEVTDERLSDVLRQSGKSKLIAEKEQGKGGVAFGKYAKSIYSVASIINNTHIRISLLNVYASVEELKVDFSIDD